MSLSDPSTPPNIATNYSGWNNYKSAREQEFENNCPLARATTYYFDATNGLDGNDGLSEDSPKQTRAAAIAIGGTNTAFLFKCGEVWRESGNWTLGSNNTVASYGSGAKPVFDRFTVRHLAANNDWGTPTGNRKQVADATDVAWVKLADFPLTRPLQKVVDEATCTTTDNSWVWVSNVLYINLAGDDPNDYDIDVCPTNDGESGVLLGGDGSRVEGLRGYGFGLHRTDPDTQDQPFTSSATGNNANLIVDCEAYYSDNHVIAHNSPSGGRLMVKDCRAGYAKYSPSSETIYNFYAAAGGHEAWAIDCHVDYGTLPSNDWTPATNIQRGAGFYCHTGGADSGLYVVSGCTLHCDNTYGPSNNFHAGNSPSVTAADLTTYRVFYVNNVRNKPAAPIAPNTHLITPNSVQYGNRFSDYPANASPNAWDTTQRQNVWFLNNYFTFDMTSVGNNNFGLWNPGGSSEDWITNWHHNLIELSNASATTGSRFGLDFDCRGITTATGNGVPGAGTSRNSTFVNNILSVNKVGGGNVYFLGLTNSTNCKNNVLFEITNSVGVERGYNLTTNPIIASVAPVFDATHVDILESGDNTLLLSHDINGKQRLVTTPDIGPVDFSSPIVTNTGVQRCVQSRVKQGVRRFVTKNS